MATRSQIGFYEEAETNLNNFESLIYRHWDGSPKTVLADIMPILKDFDTNRGLDDLEYASAWLVAKLKDDYLNIGISKDFHWDIEYFYAITPTKVKVYKVLKLIDEVGIEKAVKLIETHEVKKWGANND